MLLGKNAAVDISGEVQEECSGKGGISNNEKILYRNLWYNPTYLLGVLSVRNMGFLKQLPKSSTPNISI